MCPPELGIAGMAVSLEMPETKPFACLLSSLALLLTADFIAQAKQISSIALHWHEACFACKACKGCRLWHFPMRLPSQQFLGLEPCNPMQCKRGILFVRNDNICMPANVADLAMLLRRLSSLAVCL